MGFTCHAVTVIIGMLPYFKCNLPLWDRHTSFNAILSISVPTRLWAFCRLNSFQDPKNQGLFQDFSTNCRSIHGQLPLKSVLHCFSNWKDYCRTDESFPKPVKLFLGTPSSGFRVKGFQIFYFGHVSFFTVTVSVWRIPNKDIFSDYLLTWPLSV